MNNKPYGVQPDGKMRDTARVEMSIIGPWWSPLMRTRIYMDHEQPGRHITQWWVYPISKYIGSWTPPPWFLRLIGQSDPKSK